MDVYLIFQRVKVIKIKVIRRKLQWLKITNLNKLKGNIKETVGNATDNKDLEQEGKEDKTSGKAKEFVDNAKEKANDVIDKFKGNKGDN